MQIQDPVKSGSAQLVLVLLTKGRRQDWTKITHIVINIKPHYNFRTLRLI
jgi:hypothetical protein